MNTTHTTARAVSSVTAATIRHSFPEASLKRLPACVLAALALALPLTAAAPASAAPSAAAACSYHSWGPNDGGYAFSVSNKTSPLRPGPYTDCGTTVRLPANTELSLDCRTYNDPGRSLWYHVSVYLPGKGSYEGWIYSANVGAIYDSNGAWC